MKFLRYLVGIPAILVLGLIACVLALPNLLYGISVQIYVRILRIVCWSVGKHTFDIYAALMLDDLESLKCKCCGTFVPKDKILEITQQRDDLKRQITLVAHHIHETQENEAISAELSKLEG